MGEQEKTEISRRNHEDRNLGEQNQSPEDRNLSQRTKRNAGREQHNG